jgi:hypothetical protein
MKKGITTMKNIEKIIKVQLCKEMIEELNLTESTVFETRVKDGFLVLHVVDKENSHFDEDSYEEGFSLPYPCSARGIFPPYPLSEDFPGLCAGVPGHGR